MATTLEVIAALFIVLAVVGFVFGAMGLAQLMVLIVVIAIVTIVLQRVLHVSVSEGGGGAGVSKA